MFNVVPSIEVGARDLQILRQMTCRINALGERAVIFIDPLQLLLASRVIGLDIVDISTGLHKSDEGLNCVPPYNDMYNCVYRIGCSA